MITFLRNSGVSLALFSCIYTGCPAVFTVDNLPLGKLSVPRMKILDVPQSGSLAGQTSSHNRAGQYRRSRRAPVQPTGTGRRGFIRAAFGAASSGWSGLTDPVRLAWGAFAVGFPVTDALGQSVTLTGHQMYVGVATALANVGGTPPAAPPVSTATISPVVVVSTMTHAGVGTLTLAAGGLSTDFVLIAFSKPMGAGRSFVGTYWQQTHIAANVVTATLFGPGYVAQFGAPTVGQKIGYKLTPVNQYGVTGTPVKGLIVVT